MFRFATNQNMEAFSNIRLCARLNTQKGQVTSLQSTLK